MAQDSEPTGTPRPAEAELASDRTGRVVEGLSAILLALAAVAAAWCGYQSARWGGVQASAVAAANVARLDASRASATGGQLTQIDVASFFQAADAFAADDTELFDFYVERMRPEFRPVFDEWLALEPLTNPDAPLSPFALASYSVSQLEEAERLNRVAEEETVNAADARDNANKYAINVVFLAAALFFAGVSTKFSSFGMRIALLSLGAVAFVAILVRILLLPISFGV